MSIFWVKLFYQPPHFWHISNCSRDILKMCLALQHGPTTEGNCYREQLRPNKCFVNSNCWRKITKKNKNSRKWRKKNNKIEIVLISCRLSEGFRCIFNEHFVAWAPNNNNIYNNNSNNSSTIIINISIDEQTTKHIQPVITHFCFRTKSIPNAVEWNSCMFFSVRANNINALEIILSVLRVTTRFL